MLAWIAVALAIAVFVPPLIKLERSKKRIVEEISRALGRQVTVNAVSLRLFPQPGFELKKLTVQDDPAFSAEPLLRADEVTASLRLSSLWRWRLEIGSLTLKSPDGGMPWSLNLVRTPDGRWNVASLLTRAAQTPSAPTPKLRPESRARFPYLEGVGGRINFKSGMEKTPYALSDADFALWQPVENEWQLRLRAQPMRTDANLSDTGTLEVDGALGRADKLDQMPLRLRFVFAGAQLGQLTRLIYGRDRGWRGTVNLSADLTGSAQELKISGSGTVDDFRRYDIILPDHLRLDARCSGIFQWQAHEISGVECQAQNGAIALRGRLGGLLGSRDYDLTLTAKQLPMSELAELARHAKFALPPDLGARGVLDAEFSYRTADSGWTGSGSTREFVLRSGVLGKELRLGSVRFAVNADETGLSVEPFAMAAGGSTPAVVQAFVSRTAYNVEARGEADLRRLFQVARGLGLRAPNPALTGNAKIDLRIAGNWSGFTAPVVTGSMQLRNLIMPLQGVGEPAHVRSATAVLQPDEVRVQNLAASFPGSGIVVDGSVVLPRTCGFAQGCAARFDLHASHLAADDLNRLLNPQLHRVPWYRVLAPERGTSLRDLAAQGRIRIDRFGLKALDIERVVAQVDVHDRDLRISDFRAETLGGKLRGVWQADFSSVEPSYSGSGVLERVSLTRVATLTHTDWVTGTANGKFTIKLSGWDASNLEQSAEGTLDFNCQDSQLHSLALDGNGGPLRVKHFAGRAMLSEGRLEFQPSRMETADGIYTVSGTAAPGRLDLKFAGKAPRAYAVSGTLEKPRVALLPASATQAALGR